MTVGQNLVQWMCLRNRQPLKEYKDNTTYRERNFRKSILNIFTQCSNNSLCTELAQKKQRNKGVNLRVNLLFVTITLKLCIYDVTTAIQQLLSTY